jgi:hypothetical protein
MKNYKSVLAVLSAGLFMGSIAQAAHVKEHAAFVAAAPLHDAGHIAARPGQAHKFVDSDPVSAARTAAGPVPAHAAGALSQAAAQSFAGSPVAAAQGGPARVDLANTQAAAERISEPASELLLLIALSALAIAVRRQSPT